MKQSCCGSATGSSTLPEISRPERLGAATGDAARVGLFATSLSMVPDTLYVVSNITQKLS
jgi:hypothetical protein